MASDETTPVTGQGKARQSVAARSNWLVSKRSPYRASRLRVCASIFGEPSKAWTVALGRRSSSAWLSRPSPQHSSTTCDGGGVSGTRLQIVSICCSRSGT